MALSTVGPYRILERLGAGANGEVFLAEDTRLQRRVALKTLSGTAGSDATGLRRKLLREARAAARLNHPHIAAVYDVLESDEGVHIVMEYARGATLSAQVRQAPPAPMRVLDIALQLSDALAHAHGMGVIHRDLKPANIVVAPDGQAKILDFGLARLHAMDLGSTPLPSSELSVDARHTVGTPPYIPPEHLSGAPVDERGDVYSLGVTLFEALTGRRPFEASGRGLAEAILSAPTPRPRSLCPEVPAGLDAIVFKAMARNPAERYASAAEMRADLRRLSEGITDAPTQSRPLALPRLGGRRRAVTAAVAVLAVALAIYGALRPVAAPGRPVASGNVVALLSLDGTGADTDAVAAAVSDDLARSLARVPRLTVVPRSSPLKPGDRLAQLDKVAAESGATAIVDGTLERLTDRLRISLAIREPGSKVERWRRSFPGPDAPSLGRTVAAALAGAFSLPPLPDEDARHIATHDTDAFAEYSQARDFLRRPDDKENVDRSIALFRTAVAKDPEFARAYAGLGEASWRKYQATRDEQWAAAALEAMGDALRLDRGDATIRLSLAAIYRGKGRLDDAIDELEAVIEAIPHSDEAHRQLGQVLVMKGDTARGIDEMKKAIQLRPGYWVHHQTLGTAYFNLGRYDDAIASFERMTVLQSNNPMGYSLLGTAHHAKDDTDAALSNYEKATQLGSAIAYGNLGILYFDKKRYGDAARAFSKAVELDPGSPLKRLNLGNAHAALGRSAEARSEYERALESSVAHVRANPTDTRALARQAIIEAKLGLGAEADGHSRQAVTRDPTNADVWMGRTIVLIKADRLDEAVKAAGEAFALTYSRKRAVTDPDLAPLLERDDFKALFKEMEGGTH